MKKTIIILALVFVWLNANSQTKETSTKVFFDIGYKTTALDFNINGPVLGISFSNPQKKFSFSARNDILLAINKPLTADGTRGEYVQITDLRVQNYIEVDYRFDLNKNKLYLGVGTGWRGLGNAENIRFNREYGYSTLSLSTKYTFDWLTFELRGDIPIRNNYFKKYNGTARLFPITIAVFYKFSENK